MSDNVHRGGDFNDFLNEEIAKDSELNKQKWLCDKISGDWLDKDCIIDITLIECLRHYIEVEKGLKNPADLQEEIAKGLIGNKRLAKLQEIYDDLSSAYEYIITKYDKQNEGMKDFTVRQMFEAAGKQRKEIDDVVAKIWKHRYEMWT